MGAGRGAGDAWELDKLGALVPPPRTIKAILDRAGATRRERPQRRLSKGVPYPSPPAERSGELVQVDLVGPPWKRSASGNSRTNTETMRLRF